MLFRSATSPALTSREASRTREAKQFETEPVEGACHRDAAVRTLLVEARAAAAAGQPDPFKKVRKMIKDTEAAIDAAKIQLSETAATLAKTKGQLTETKANLHDDTKYLKDLTAQCEMKANEWDQRSTMRAGELKALQEAIDIVGGTASNAGTRGYTDNTASLLQGGAASADSYTDVVFTQLKAVKKSGQAAANQARLDAVTQIKHMARKQIGRAHV